MPCIRQFVAMHQVHWLQRQVKQGWGTAGKSNSGEGGEDPVRWLNLQDVDDKGVSGSLPHLKGLVKGDTATSRIKQVRHNLSFRVDCASTAPQLLLQSCRMGLCMIGA